MEGEAADQFTLSIDGVAVNQTSVDFDAATDLTSLAAELDNIPGIDVSRIDVATSPAAYDDATTTAIPDNLCASTQDIVIANVPTHFRLGDVDLGFNATHAYRWDLQVSLRSPMGTEVLVISQVGINPVNENYDVLLDDESGNSLNDGNDDVTASPYYDRDARPFSPLTQFDGEDAFGAWTLKICDRFNPDIGIYNRSRLILKTSSLRIESSTAGQPVFSNLALIKTSPQVTNIDSTPDTGDGSLLEDEGISVGITQLSVDFNSAVLNPSGHTDPDDVSNPNNYLLFEDGVNNTFETVNCALGVAGDDIAIITSNVGYNSVTRSAWFTVNNGTPLPAGTFRLLVCGSTSISDSVGQALDGMGNGTAGDDFIRNFTVLDFDGDGDPDYSDPDDDGDGMTDVFENSHPNLDPFNAGDANADDDLDGLTNLEEFNKHPSLNPNNPDTDFDGIQDDIDNEPVTFSNLCEGPFFDLDSEIIDDFQQCASFSSAILRGNSYVTPDGFLMVISNFTTIESGFYVELGGEFAIMSAHPCPACPVITPPPPPPGAQ